MADKSEKEEWSKNEMLGTAFSTPHEWHSFVVGFARGLSEGTRLNVPGKYQDEEAYFTSGWCIGEIIDRLTNESSDDTKMALAQLAGIVAKYGIIAGLAIAGYNFIV